MRIDEFKALPTNLINAADRMRLESVGFDILAHIISICYEYLNSHINPELFLDSGIVTELPMSSHINTELYLDGDLCR